MSLDRLFYPRAVAVVGSTAPGKLGHVLIRQILEGGFRALYAVNPRAQGLGEVPGFEAVSAIGRPVDLAVIASPADTVAAVLEDCGRAGVSAAVVISAGFSEVGNLAGEEEIRRVARKYGMRVVGPNCAGIFNSACAFYPTLEVRPPVGRTALISQSGALAGAILAWAEEQGLGFSKFVSYGNRVDVDEVDLLPYLAEDPETAVVALYIESVRDGREFMRAVDAFTRRKPLVVIKAGRSKAGQRAALSHTGSLAGADAVYDAALRQCGAIRVETIEELFDLCKGFVSLPPVRGRRVAVVTNSGGPGVMAADWEERLGIEMPEPGPALRERLSAFLPAYCSTRNPFDLTVEGTAEDYRRTLEAVLDEYDAALALDVNPPHLDPVPVARGVCQAAAVTGKPVVAAFMAGRTVASALPVLRGGNVPDFPTGERALRVLARLADYEQAKARPRGLSHTPVEKRNLPGPRPMLEPEAMAWLADNGIPTPAHRFALTADEAVVAARELGYPVVMKVVAEGILHKTEVGGVILDIRDDQGVRDAFRALKEVGHGRGFRGVLVYPLIRGAHEVLLGAARDPQFGPVVVLGLGGIYTEVLHDVVLRVAPVDRREAEGMIGKLKAVRLLRGARGQPPADLDALAEVLVRFSQLPFLYPEVKEIDLNPVFLFSQGLLVGDARVIT